MKKYPTLMTLILVLAIAWMAGPATAMAAQHSDGIQWLTYDEGLRRGEQENKKLFLVFNADWCRYCHQMETETFQNPTVIAYINRNFIPVSVNSDRQHDVAQKYGVRGLPSTWFIAEDGQRIGSRPGYIPADEMLKILKYIGSDSYLKMSFQAFLENSP